MTTRLEKFRGYMARLNPAGDPLGAIRDGLYVPRPGRSTADEVAARLELDPTSSHLIIGGIGSGKTTQLLVARDRLNKLADTRAEYIDVSLVHDLSHMAPGTLIVAAGLAVSRLLESDDDAAQAEFDRLYRAWIDAVGFSSSLTRKVSHPAYQGIIAMGKRAISPILRDLEKEPKLWGPALHAITGAQPVPPGEEGKMARVAAAWLRWARENGYDW